MLRWLIFVAALASALPAFAATPVFVDGAGVCAGLTPCFTTIQQGVNNAGPPPAIVNVFPGDYSETVDVGLMGSAIGGSTGDLTLRTVDADGDPAFGTARILPAAGDGILNTAPPFMGDLFIHGFTVKSLAGDGILLSMVQGTVELRGVVSDENAGSGLIAEITAGDLRVIDSSFSGNLSSTGLIIDVSGDLDLERVDANDNADDGMIASVVGNARIRQSSFDDNKGGDGFILSVDGDLDIEASSFDRNGGNGAVASIGGNARIHQSSFDDNKGGDGFILSVDGDLDIEASSFDRNDSGGAIASVGGNARIHQSSFDDNKAGVGFLFSVDGDLDIEASSFDRNSSNGAIASAGGNARIHQSSFDDNKAGVGFIFSVDGDLDIEASSFDRNDSGGVVASAGGDVRIHQSSFDRNNGDGALLGVDGAVAALDSSFSGNMGGGGLTMSSDGPFEATRIVANDNDENGLNVFASSHRISASRFEGNGAAGVRLGSAGADVLRCNDIAGNTDGLVVGDSSTVVAETNFWGSPSGPTHPSNPAGTGDTVRDSTFGGSGTVDFIPFLTKSAAKSGQCVAHPAPALDRMALLILSLALLVLPARRLMRAGATGRA